MKRLLLLMTSTLLAYPDVSFAQATTRPAPGQQRPVKRPNQRPPRPNPGQNVRPTRPAPGHQKPNRPGRPDRPSIQPVRPNRPNRPRPPVTIQPIRPPRPHRPGWRPPNFRPIHRPGFYYPHGYHYRRWHVGLYLPWVFLADRYYFYDWSLLGLGPPPHGYVWVRYGPDLLLVDRHSRRVVDVIYGVFA